jgi:hypothetical protein
LYEKAGLIMRSINKTEYTEILYAITSKTICQVWYPSNKYMAECEFIEQLDTLFNAAKTFKPKLIYIDAFNFCFPISNKSIQQIKQYIDNCEIKSYTLVMSSTLLGRLQLLHLKKELSLNNYFTINTFDTKDEGEHWLSLQIMKALNVEQNIN